ncbi:LLM class F420-dependent oxidoreductase [Catenulispora subtropica]|uniref:LLM class F420-dependent oxidoreductase n=1 Tax=Catenulispora subtropica TaxID=450798 RepID=A0ABN2SX24_9ACTN
MARFKVGVQIRPQHTDITALRQAWERADALGVDAIFTWDHFYPLTGDPEGTHFEGSSLLAAMAVTTTQARFGMLVYCNSYRNPELLADMSRTIDQLSGGRHILGIGAGWFQRDYDEYGYEFGTAPDRLRALRDALPRIKERLGKLKPAAADLPIMIGGGGEKVTLRLVAEYADLWNTFGPVENFRHKNNVLNEWCAKVGRDPKAVERTVMIRDDEIDDYQSYLDAGADHIILGADFPYAMDNVERLLAHARS